MKLMILTKKSRQLILFLLVLLSSFFLHGEQEFPREFDEKAMSSYAESNEYSYMELRVRPPSIWERLQWWFASILAKIFTNPNTPWLSNIVFYVLLILVLSVAIWYIIRLRYGGGTTTNAKYAGLVNVKTVETNKVVDFDRLIQEAVKARDFKLAVRYCYLKSLILLSEKGLVKLKDWKSPYDYNRELSNEIAPIYRDLSKLFEYVWYGDFNASEREFERGSQLVQEIQRRAI